MGIMVEIEDGRIKGYETTKEFAERMNVLDGTVREWIHRGILTTLKVGDVNWIPVGTERPTNEKKGRHWR